MKWLYHTVVTGSCYLLLCTNAPLVLCCDRFDRGSRQVQREGRLRHNTSLVNKKCIFDNLRELPTFTTWIQDKSGRFSSLIKEICEITCYILIKISPIRENFKCVCPDPVNLQEVSWRISWIHIRTLSIFSMLSGELQHFHSDSIPLLNDKRSCKMFSDYR